jgi:glycosyltransferase involved in cell wall biosynthesis
MKVAVVSTHPIQYQIPWFQKLAEQPGLDFKVYYAMLPNEEQQGVGFGVSFAWDIPLLKGYDWELVANKRKTPALGGFFSSSTPAIQSAFSDARPDVVIITGWNALPLVQALWASVRLGIPRIIRGESNALRQRSCRVKMAHRMLLAQYDAALSIGKANKDFYLQYGVAPESIFETHYFVDNRRFDEQFRSLSGERAALRAGWGVPEGHTCFLYAGKLEPKKRIMDLLRALELALGREPALHLLVAGAGELMDEARAFAESKRLPVTFAGFLNQTEITRAYAAADCLVLPSDFGETWGLVVNEAMVCGLPAIVSDRVGCGPDLVEEAVTGSIFPFGNFEALADRLCLMAADKAGLVSMGARARERVKDYSVERAVSGTLSAVEYVLSRRSREHVTGPHWSGESASAGPQRPQV